MKKKQSIIHLSKEMRQILPASSIGLVFIISIVIGVLLGVWLDGKLDTKPIFTLFFLFIGIASGIRNAYMFIKKSIALEESPHDARMELKSTQRPQDVGKRAADEPRRGD